MLVRRQIGGSLEYGHPHLYEKSAPGTILADTTMASMTGTLAQIGLLSHYATEIFRDVFTLTEELHGRLESATARTAGLVDQLPAVLAKVEATDGNSGGRAARPHDFASDEPTRIAFNRSTMPRSIKERYESEFMVPTPDLSKVDAALPPDVLEREGPCVQKYSHPGFFLDQWAAEEMKRIESIKEKKKAAKEERKRRRRLQGRSDSAHATKAKRKDVDGGGLDWKNRYGVDGDEAAPAVDIKPDADAVARPTSQRLSDAPGFGAAEAPPPAAKPKPPPPPPKGGKPKPPPPMPKLATPPQPDGGAAKPAKPPPPPGSAKKKPPPPPPKGGKPKPPPPPMPKMAPASFDEDDEAEERLSRKSSVRESDGGASESLKESAAYAKYFKMLQMGIPKAAVQMKMASEGLDAAVLDDSDDDEPAAPSKPKPPPQPGSKPPPPPPKAKPAPPPPTVAAPPRPAMGGLLGAIQQGATLKKAAPPPPKKAAPENPLLAAIKRGGNLRKVEVSDTKPEPPKKAGLFGNEVDKILGLRARIAADSGSDSSDDSDWDD